MSGFVVRKILYLIDDVTTLPASNEERLNADIIAAKDGIERAKINFLTERLTITSELSPDDVLALAREAAVSFEDGITIE